MKVNRCRHLNRHLQHRRPTSYLHKEILRRKKSNSGRRIFIFVLQITEYVTIVRKNNNLPRAGATGGSAGAAAPPPPPPQLPAGPLFTESAGTHIWRQKVMATLCT